MDKNNFSFKGRYTLREINETWYIYDRELQTTIKDLHEATFTKAKNKLIEFKIKNNDEV